MFQTFNPTALVLGYIALTIVACVLFFLIKNMIFNYKWILIPLAAVGIVLIFFGFFLVGYLIGHWDASRAQEYEIRQETRDWDSEEEKYNFSHTEVEVT